MRKRLANRLLSRIGIVLSVLVFLISSLFVGAYPIGIKEVINSLFGGAETTVSDSVNYLIWHIRLPRILMAFFVGAGLASSGAAIQGLFRNPLADPALIGITSGAMVFAVAGIVLGSTVLAGVHAFFGLLTSIFLAFLGSLGTTYMVYRLATSNGRTSVATMLLAGIAMTALAGAITGLLTYFSSEEALRDITFWTLGSVGGANWQLLSYLAPVILIALGFLLSIHKELDLLALGEQEATYLGVKLQRVKWIVIGCAALVVGSSVAMCGVISFLALVVPHLVRLIKGNLHKGLLIGSALLGGILLLVADAFARTIIAPMELPIGILTALLGAPFFIGLLLKSKKQYTNW